MEERERRVWMEYVLGSAGCAGIDVCLGICMLRSCESARVVVSLESLNERHAQATYDATMRSRESFYGAGAASC